MYEFNVYSVSRRCVELLSRDQLDRVLMLIEQEPPHNRPGRFSPGHNPDLVRIISAELGPTWLQVSNMIEQIVWINQNRMS